MYRLKRYALDRSSTIERHAVTQGLCCRKQMKNENYIKPRSECEWDRPDGCTRRTIRIAEIVHICIYQLVPTYKKKNNNFRMCACRIETQKAIDDGVTPYSRALRAIPNKLDLMTVISNLNDVCLPA